MEIFRQKEKTRDPSERWGKIAIIAKGDGENWEAQMRADGPAAAWGCRAEIRFLVVTEEVFYSCQFRTGTKTLSPAPEDTLLMITVLLRATTSPCMAQSIPSHLQSFRCSQTWTELFSRRSREENWICPGCKLATLSASRRLKMNEGFLLYFLFIEIKQIQQRGLSLGFLHT